MVRIKGEGLSCREPGLIQKLETLAITRKGETKNVNFTPGIV